MAMCRPSPVAAPVTMATSPATRCVVRLRLGLFEDGAPPSPGLS
jgi:hypothetical protein